MSRLVWIAMVSSCVAKPRELFEIGPEDKATGLEPFYEGNMAPWQTSELSSLDIFHTLTRLVIENLR